MQSISIDLVDVTLEEVLQQVEDLIDIYGESAMLTGDADLDLFVAEEDDVLESSIE